MGLMLFIKGMSNKISAPKFGTGSIIFLSITSASAFLPLLESALSGSRGVQILSRISPDSIHWYLSTIAQSMAAVFGIGGLFAAHIVQSIGKRIDTAFEEARQAAHLAGLSPSPNNDIFYNELKSSLDGTKRHYLIISDYKPMLNEAISRIDTLRKFKGTSIDSFKAVAAYLVASVIIPVSTLLVGTDLARYRTSAVFLFLLLILVLVCLLKTVHFIWEAVQG